MTTIPPAGGADYPGLSECVLVKAHIAVCGGRKKSDLHRGQGRTWHRSLRVGKDRHKQGHHHSLVKGQQPAAESPLKKRCQTRTLDLQRQLPLGITRQ